MLRFCDKEICCIRNDELNRVVLLDYFLNGHRNGVVYIVDQFGKYIGSISYKGLLGRELEDAISSDCIIMDENIWENGRKYFSSCREQDFAEVNKTGIPVINKERELISFAWQDTKANRELRMLEELMNCADVLTFKDLYPQIECVKIYGCNELTYLLMQYLQDLQIPVNVSGKFWEEILAQERIKIETWNEEQVLDYNVYTIYGEGLSTKGVKAERYTSVSVEFECIDRIYEENICNGIISDTAGNFEELLKRLEKKQIALIWFGKEGEISFPAYDLLLENGLDISCFITGNPTLQGKIICGKEVLSRIEAVEKMEDIVFINAKDQYSAWGSNYTDDYHYYGHKRNEQFFLLNDYVQITDHSLQNLLNFTTIQLKRRLVLVGDLWLCIKLKRKLEDKQNRICGKIVYSDILNRNHEVSVNEISQINVNEICDEDICLLLLSGYYGSYYKGMLHTNRELEQERIIEKIKKFTTASVINYPCETKFFMEEEKGVNHSADLKIKNIIIGSIEGRSGNVFFRHLLDGHPNILMLDHGYLNDNLFSICIRMATANKSDAMDLLWKLYNIESNNKGLLIEGASIDIFNKSMEEMLNLKESFLPQELFVMIHVAYAKAFGKEIKDLSSMTIYWEPHNMMRDKTENYAQWLADVGDSRYIINVVRNHCIRAGSALRHIFEREQIWNKANIKYLFYIAGNDYRVNRKDYDGWERIILKFEDLKCNSKNELQGLCQKIGIMWSESLLKTTFHGWEASYDGTAGFDIKPVFNGHYEYLSCFDHFRLSLLLGPWQKKYGYQYARSIDFSRRELQEMFVKEFRFEEKLVYENEEQREEMQRWKQDFFNEILLSNRRIEIMEKINGI